MSRRAPQQRGVHGHNPCASQFDYELRAVLGARVDEITHLAHAVERFRGRFGDGGNASPYE